jgi:hypothetical protein
MPDMGICRGITIILLHQINQRQFMKYKVPSADQLCLDGFLLNVILLLILRALTGLPV